jgi:tetratricopeptide (TPR) repeat protein
MKLKLFLLTPLALLILATNTLAEPIQIQDKINQCNQLIKDEKSEEALKLALRLIAQEKNNREAMLCEARAQSTMGQYRDSISTLNSALSLAKQPLDRMITLTMLGNSYKNLEMYPEAKAQYESILLLAQTHKNTGFQRIAHSLMGSIEYLKNEYDSALKSYLASLKYAANDNERADIYSRISEIYKSTKNLDASIEYQIKALIATAHYGDLEKQAEAGLTLGRLYAEAKQYKQAEQALYKVLNLSIDNEGPYFTVISYIEIIKLKLATNDNHEARQLIEKAKKVNQELGDNKLNKDIIELEKKIPL